ncbi:MAG: apolipoprotein N-acyltransferase [Polyangiaceae bacterium]|nr:apolipoprotein N-acyltransferase [Polyangiaceae bacterium]
MKNDERDESSRGEEREASESEAVKNEAESDAASESEGASDAENEAESDAPASDEKAAAGENKAPSSDRSAQKSAWNPRPVVTPRVGYALSVLTALLYFLAFPGTAARPFAFVAFFAFVPWLYAIRGQTPRMALKMSWLMMFVGASCGFYWLVNMLEVFSGFPLPLCVLFAAILNVYQSGRMAVTGWLYGRATERGWPHAPVFIAAFVAGELVYPLLFPWYAGVTMHDWPIMMQVADLGGPFAVSVMLMGSNLAIAELIEVYRRMPANRVTMAVGFAVPVIAALYGKIRMSSIDAKVANAEKIRVGMVQPYNDLFNRRDALRTHLDMTKELQKKEPVDLVVWSEAPLGRAFSEERYKQMVKFDVTGKLGVPSIVGALLVRQPDRTKDPTAKRDFFNVALMADEKGNIIGRYDKQFLLMFGEYLPFGDVFPIMYKWSPNSSKFTPGTSFAPLEWKGHRISTMICYEDILPSFVNKLVAAGDPDLFVNLTNDTWFGNTTEPWIHLALAKFRSIEHRLYLIRVTNSGVSAIVDPNGRVTVHGGVYTKESIIGEARFLRERTVYSRIGDAPWWTLSLLVGIAAFRKRKGTNAARS